MLFQFHLVSWGQLHRFWPHLYFSYGLGYHQKYCYNHSLIFSLERFTLIFFFVIIITKGRVHNFFTSFFNLHNMLLLSQTVLYPCKQVQSCLRVLLFPNSMDFAPFYMLCRIVSIKDKKLVLSTACHLIINYKLYCRCHFEHYPFYSFYSRAQINLIPKVSLLHPGNKVGPGAQFFATYMYLSSVNLNILSH